MLVVMKLIAYSFNYKPMRKNESNYHA